MLQSLFPAFTAGLLPMPDAGRSRLIISRARWQYPLAPPSKDRNAEDGQSDTKPFPRTGAFAQEGYRQQYQQYDAAPIDCRDLKIHRPTGGRGSSTAMMRRRRGLTV